MKNFGFIGFGSMAKMIIHGLIEYANISPDNIYVTRKNKDKLYEINHAFKGVIAVDSCQSIMSNAQIVFLCARPVEAKSILSEIASLIKDDTHIISLAGSVSIKNLQSTIQGKITKYMPTITSEIGVGVSLICHNDYVTPNDADYVESIISRFSKIKHVQDEDWGFAAELTSCMPGFIASIFDNLTNAAIEHTASFNKDVINELITDTLYATAKLFSETGMSFEQVVARVATKGGVTQEGVIVFDEVLPQVFYDMFEKTLTKRRLVAEKINIEFQADNRT
jgi:pyrroline-5-carboxylate reductase